MPDLVAPFPYEGGAAGLNHRLPGSPSTKGRAVPWRCASDTIRRRLLESSALTGDAV